MVSSLSLLSTLAARMAMPPSACVALPVAVEVFASKAGMTIEQMVSECMENSALRDYLAETCIKAEAAL